MQILPFIKSFQF